MTTAKVLQRRAMKTSWLARSSKLTDNEVADALRRTADPFIRTLEWKALRKLAIDRYGAVCCKCGKDGTKSSPINFDHIKPRKYFPELALDIENIQPLCARCNKTKGNLHQTDYRKKPAGLERVGS